MENRNIQEVLGLDVGAVRVGIARGNMAPRIAQPLKTVAADKAIEEVKALIKVHSADAIVVGLPRSLDGNETDQTKQIRNWAKAAQQAINLPFYWQDEALTSQLAEDSSNKADSLGIDARAAAHILQDFLDSAEDDRVAV